MSGFPPFPISGQATTSFWNCECAGCGAPLQTDQIQCSYCRRAAVASSSQSAQRLSDLVASGARSVNEARQLIEVTTIGDTVQRFVDAESGREVIRVPQPGNTRR